VAEGTAATLGGRDHASYEVSFTLPAEVTVESLPLADGDQPELGREGRVVIRSARVMATLRGLSAWAIDRGYDIPDLRVQRPTLEDIYLELTEQPR
jgi:ABC-2 type transport system ATP-binding protein